MRVSYDVDADAAYLSLVDRDLRAGEAVEQSQIIATPSGTGSLIVDFDAAGRMLGIEVLCASAVLPPDLLRDSRI